MNNLTNCTEANVLDLSQRNLPRDGLSMFDSFEFAGSNKIELNALTLHQLQLRLSQSSQKRFVFVDRCGGECRIYFYPSVLKDLSDDTDVSDPFAIRAENGFRGFQPVTGALSSKQLNNGDSAEASMAYKSPLPSSFAAVSRIHSARGKSMFSKGMQSRIHPSFSETKTSVHSGDVSWDDNKFFDAKFSNSQLNGTDDLEALLITDDEVSTGQFPAENIAWGSEVDGLHAHKQQKMRAGEIDLENENHQIQDVDQDSTLLSFIVKESEGQFPWIERGGSFDLSTPRASTNNNLLQFSEKTPRCSHGSKLLSADASSSSSEFSSSNSVLKRKNSATLLPSLSGSAKKSRSNQIRQMFQLLQSIIPGSDDHVDAASVLEKAIQYVGFLQQKVEALEENRHLEIHKQMG